MCGRFRIFMFQFRCRVITLVYLPVLYAFTFPLMKSVFSFLFVLVFAIMAQCQGNKATTAAQAINKNLPVAEYDQRLQKQNYAQLLDVRTLEEYSGGYLKNAVNIDYNAPDFE